MFINLGNEDFSLSLSLSVYYQSIIMIFSNNFVIIVSTKRLFITCLFLTRIMSCLDFLIQYLLRKVNVKSISKDFENNIYIFSSTYYLSQKIVENMIWIKIF